MKLLIKIVIVFTLLAILGAGVLTYLRVGSEVASFNSRTESDGQLIPILEDVAIGTTDELSIIYDDTLEYSDAKAVYSSLTIYVKPGIDLEKSKVVIAHEYLHYIWYEVMTEEQRNTITSKVVGLYAKDVAMQTRTIPYQNTDTLLPTELFSIYCTESTDSYMLSIVDECNKYIDRSKLL